MRIEIEWGEHVLVVEYSGIPGRAAITGGPPDNWAPADPPEFEVDKVYLRRGKKLRLLPDEGDLYYDVIEHNWDLMADYAEAYWDDARATHEEERAERISAARRGE